MEDQKAAIAALFYQGKLRQIEGDYTPCDLNLGCVTLPFLLLSNFLAPVGLVVIFGQYLLRKPESLGQFLKKLQELSFQENLLIAALILFVLGLSGWLFFAGLPELRLILSSFQEAIYQRKTQQYRYGLLLTRDHLAIRCFANFYDDAIIHLSGKTFTTFAAEPLIFSRQQILNITSHSERLETKQRIHYLVLSFYDHDHKQPQYLRLPDSHLNIQRLALLNKIQHWLG